MENVHFESIPRHVTPRINHLIQSLYSKELTLIEHLGSNNADMCIVTETWLNDDDQVWLQSSEFNKNGWKCYNINRQGR